jgi:hypothetical protein
MVANAGSTFLCQISNLGTRSVSVTVRFLDQTGADAVTPNVMTVAARSTGAASDFESLLSLRRCVFTADTTKTNLRAIIYVLNGTDDILTSVEAY